MTVSGPVLLDATRYWQCPSCVAQHITRIGGVITPMHNCGGQAGILVPYVQAFPGRLERPADRRHHRPIVRDDYEADELGLRHDVNGRPIAAVHTERPDGSHDTHVFAPTARNVP